MRQYQFQSIIQENGLLKIPPFLYNLKNRRLKFIVVDLERPRVNPVAKFRDIIRRFYMIDEPDLDIDAIYAQRKEHHDRGIVFD